MKQLSRAFSALAAACAALCLAGPAHAQTTDGYHSILVFPVGPVGRAVGSGPVRTRSCARAEPAKARVSRNARKSVRMIMLPVSCG